MSHKRKFDVNPVKNSVTEYKNGVNDYTRGLFANEGR
jgi:hypothetical protein